MDLGEIPGVLSKVQMSIQYLLQSDFLVRSRGPRNRASKLSSLIERHRQNITSEAIHQRGNRLLLNKLTLPKDKMHV